jgi:hypothetical protein
MQDVNKEFEKRFEEMEKFFDSTTKSMLQDIRSNEPKLLEEQINQPSIQSNLPTV